MAFVEQKNGNLFEVSNKIISKLYGYCPEYDKKTTCLMCRLSNGFAIREILNDPAKRTAVDNQEKEEHKQCQESEPRSSSTM